MQVVLIEEARERGLKRYFTGEACPDGHIAERIVSSRGCIQCAKIATRVWKQNNKARLSAYNLQYAREHCERVNERNRINRKRNPERIKAQKAAEYRANKARYQASAKAYREANKEKIEEAKRRLVSSNRSRYSAYKRNYKARKRLAEGSHTAADIASIMMSQRGKCGYCRCKLDDRYHVDHIIALFNGGSNHRRNLQILCGPCNNAKRAKDPIDFARSKGLLI